MRYLNKAIDYEEGIELKDLKTIEDRFQFKFPDEIIMEAH